MALAPTYARRELGSELKRLREAAGFTQARVAKAHSWSSAKVIRLEGGTVSLTLHDLHLLADFYNADDEERKNLVALMERAEEGQWWEPYSRLIPIAMDEFLSLESQATGIRFANMSLFPGLLQSRTYMEALFSESHLVPDPDDVESLIDLRLKRQRVIERGTRLNVVLSEALFAMPTGGRDVHKHQLTHILALAELPHVTIRAIPLNTTGALVIGGVTVFEFDANATAVAYTEHQGGLSVYHVPSEVRRHKRELTRLEALAWSPEETRTNLQERINQL